MTNVVGFPLRARFSLNVQDAALSAWLTTDEAPEQDFTIGGSQDYTLQISVPYDARQGDYHFRLDVLDLALPDETLTPSDLITVRVPPVPPTHVSPVVIAVGVIALIVVIAVAVVFVLNNQPARLPSLIAYASRAPASDSFKLTFASANDMEQQTNLTTLNSYVQPAVKTGASSLQIERQPFSLTGYEEAAPAWSPQGCQIAYSAQVTVGHYLLQPGETLSDVQARLVYRTGRS